MATTNSNRAPRYAIAGTTIAITPQALLVAKVAADLEKTIRADAQAVFSPSLADGGQ